MSDKNNNSSNLLIELIDAFVQAFVKMIEYFVQHTLPKVMKNIACAIKERRFKLLFRFGEIDLISFKSHKKLEGLKDREGTWGYSANEEKYVSINEFDTSRHSIIVGASGAGKSNFGMGLLEKSASENKSVVMIDPKGHRSDLENFILIAKKHKKKFYIFEPMYLGEGRINLNTLKDLDHGVIDSVIMNCFEWSDPYYEALAYGAIQTAVDILSGENEELEWSPDIISIRDLYRNFDKDNKIEIDLFKISTVIKKIYGGSKDYQGLISNLDNLLRNPIGKNLYGRNIKIHDPNKTETKSITEITNEGAWIYIGLNKQKYQQHAQVVGKLAFSEVLYISGHRAQVTPNVSEMFSPISFMVEEFSSVVTNQIADLISKSRASLIEVSLFMQSLSDCKNVKKIEGLLEILTDITSNFIFFRQHDPENAENVARLIGTLETKKETKQTDNSSETSRGSTREVEKFVVHPNLIKTLPNGWCIAVNMGNVKKIHHLKTKLFKINEIIKIEKPKIEIKKNIEVRNSELRGVKARLHNISVIDKDNNSNSSLGV